MPPIAEMVTGLSAAIIGMICLSFVVMTALSIGLVIVTRRYIQNKVGQDKVVMEQGTAAKAKVISVQQTGVMLNNSPQILFQLEVHPPYGSPYQVTTKAVVSVVNIPQYQPGAEVSVKIHPTDPMKVEIVSG